MSEYHVRTDVYSGPMDLLLYLIRRDEIDLYDIPVSHITEQYVQYVETLRIIDPNVAGEFLVMAATLMELKSRLLLPRPVLEEEGDAEDDGDPRMALVRQLLEYKKFKDASLELSEAAEVQRRRWPRMPVRKVARDASEVDIEEAQIWDLVAAFNKVLAAVGADRATHDVVFDDTPIALHAEDILDRLKSAADGEMRFERVFEGRSKAEMIGLFLALLELIRQQRVQVRQPQPFGQITLVLMSADPIEVDEAAAAGGVAAAVGIAASDEAAEVAETAAEPDVEEDVEDAAMEGFDELDAIKTDIDIDTGWTDAAAKPRDESR